MLGDVKQSLHFLLLELLELTEDFFGHSSRLSDCRLRGTCTIGCGNLTFTLTADTEQLFPLLLDSLEQLHLCGNVLTERHIQYLVLVKRHALVVLALCSRVNESIAHCICVVHELFLVPAMTLRDGVHLNQSNLVLVLCNGKLHTVVEHVVKNLIRETHAYDRHIVCVTVAVCTAVVRQFTL